MVTLLARGLELRAKLFERKQAGGLRCGFGFLQVELPSILRNFPARVPHLAMFGACLVQHGIGVVDVQKYFTRAAHSRQLDERFFDRDVAHLSRGLARFFAIHANEFVSLQNVPSKSRTSQCSSSASNASST